MQRREGKGGSEGGTEGRGREGERRKGGGGEREKGCYDVLYYQYDGIC